MAVKQVAAVQMAVCRPVLQIVTIADAHRTATAVAAVVVAAADAVVVAEAAGVEIKTENI